MAETYGVLKSVMVTLPPVRSSRGESNSPSIERMMAGVPGSPP